jgi:hypothetical protein
VYGVENIKEVIDFFNEGKQLRKSYWIPEKNSMKKSMIFRLIFQVKGQETAKSDGSSSGGRSQHHPDRPSRKRKNYVGEKSARHSSSFDLKRSIGNH